MADNRRKSPAERRNKAILIRVTARERRELSQRARATSRSVSDFLVIQALGKRMS